MTETQETMPRPIDLDHDAAELDAFFAESAEQAFLLFQNTLLYSSVEDDNQNDRVLAGRAGRAARARALYAAILGRDSQVVVYPEDASSRALTIARDIIVRSICPCHFLPYGARVTIELSSARRTLPTPALVLVARQAASAVRTPLQIAEGIATTLIDTLSPAGGSVLVSAVLWCQDEVGQVHHHRLRLDGKVHD